jgi:hypothetical protein
MKTISKDENIILQEGKKFILKVKNGSIVNSSEGTEGYLPDLETVRTYDCAKEVWLSTLFKKSFSPNNTSFIDKLNVYEQVFNYLEKNKGLPNKKESEKIKKKLDEIQYFFLGLSNKIKDSIDEAEIINSAL